MYMNNKLPTDKEKKKINKATFAELAKKVRKILDEEAEYAEREEKKNGLNNTSRLNIIT